MVTGTNNLAGSNVYQQLGLTGNSTSGSGSTQTSNSGTLGQNAFLNLMVTELKNQDPTKPINAQNMLAQLAQFSTVSGVQNLDKTVNNLAGSVTTNESLQAASLVGKKVLTQANQATLTSGSNLKGAVKLNSPATNVSVGIYNSKGVLVRGLNLGAQASGLANFTWDGKNAQGKAMPTGLYAIKAAGLINGQAQALATLANERVSNVTIGQNGGPITLGLANGAGSIDLSKVHQIS